MTPPQHMAQTQLRPALTLDALGKKCPVPIIMLADRIREVHVGQIIEVLADDPAAKTDLPAWCALKSQEFVGTSDLQCRLVFPGPPQLLTRASSPCASDTLTVLTASKQSKTPQLRLSK